MPRPIPVLAFLVLVLAAGLPGPVEATPCTGLGELCFLTEITDGTGNITYYVDYRGFSYGPWIYEESNGIYFPRGAGVFIDRQAYDNLQRGGCSELSQSCDWGGYWGWEEQQLPPDTLIF